jgi:putative tryptophan/tyrosine transport system substrate-binding protein
MGYGSEPADDYRKAALFVGRILKGAKPIDLPVEQPTILNFTLNCKTAATLGLTLTQELLLRADE